MDFKKFCPKIYALTSPNTNLKYIGSTSLPVQIRLRNHYELYKQFLRGTNNNKCSAFKLFELGNVNIEIIDECGDVCCKKALLKRERHHIENNIDLVVNKNIPGRSLKESYKAYYENNKEKKREYYLANREKRIKYAKDYINNNKEKYNEYQKNYRNKNIS